MADEDRGQGLPLLVIAGPTAVGKTELSLQAAEALNGEIISADSAAVFRGLDIGTAKVGPPERQRVPHHGIDLVDAGESFSVADFQRMARQAIADIRRRGRFPVVVGGTGLWIRALIRDFQLPDEAGPSPLRRHLEERAERYGFESLRRQLRVVDPASYRAIQPADHRRLIRALEVFLTSGKTLARTAPHASPYDAVYWVLTRSVSDLHSRIRERTETMMTRGLAAEVIRLLEAGVDARAQSLSAIGYRETVDWYYGLVTDRERDELIVRHTQQYAKRQLTWFRSEKTARWLDLSAWPHDAALAKIVQSVQQG